MASNIKLYQAGPLADQESASPFCVKVQYALRYKRLPFEVVNVASPMAVRKLNPRGKIPVMVSDGTAIADSTDIIRFIESNHPEPPLYPPDERVRALALMLEDWADESLYWHMVYERWLVADQLNQFAAVIFAPVPAPLRPLVKRIALRQIRRNLRGQGLGLLTLAQQREKLAQALDWIDSSIGNGQFLCGASLSVADVAVATQVAGLDIPITPAVSAEVQKRANLMRWRDRVRAAVG